MIWLDCHGARWWGDDDSDRELRELKEKNMKLNKELKYDYIVIVEDLWSIKDMEMKRLYRY